MVPPIIQPLKLIQYGTPSIRSFGMTCALQVDWDFYKSCEGVIPALQQKPDASAQEAAVMIEEWNQRLCKEEFVLNAGDVAVMKGGKLTDHPCCLEFVEGMC